MIVDDAQTASVLQNDEVDDNDDRRIINSEGENKMQFSALWMMAFGIYVQHDSIMFTTFLCEAIYLF